MTRFWPTTKPASALHRNAHALPNSSGVPKRPAGILGHARGEERVVVLAGFRRELAQAVGLAVGEERTGQQVVDRDVVLRDLAREAGDEAGEPCAGAVGQAEMRERRLDRSRRDVDDAAEPRAIMPSTTARISMIGVTMLSLTALLPRGFVPVAKIADRRAAGVVDEDVGRRAGGQHRGAALGGRDVGGDADDRRRRVAPDLVGRRVQRVGAGAR